MFPNVQFKVLSEQQMQLVQYRAQQMFLDLKDEEKWNVFYGNKEQCVQSHKEEEKQEEKVQSSDAAVQVESTKPKPGSASTSQRGQRLPHLTQKKRITQNPKFSDENLSTVLEKLEKLESTLQDLRPSQNLNRNAVTIEPVIRKEQCMTRKVSRNEQVVSETESNAGRLHTLNRKLEHVLSTIWNLTPDQAQAMSEGDGNLFEHAVPNYDDSAKDLYDEMIADFNETIDEESNLKNIQDTRTKHVSFQVPYILKEAEMLEKRRANNPYLYPKRSSVRRNQGSKTSSVIKNFPSPVSRNQSISSSVSNKRNVPSSATSSLSNKRNIPSSVSNKRIVSSPVSNKQSISSSPLSSKRNISSSVSSTRNIPSAVSGKQNIKSSVPSKQSIPSVSSKQSVSSSVPDKQSGKKLPGKHKAGDKSKDNVESLATIPENQNVESAESSHEGVPELEKHEVIKKKSFSNEINLFAKKMEEIENTERMVRQRINILKRSFIKPVNESYLTATSSQENASNVQNTQSNIIKSDFLLRETKASRKESLQKEPDETIDTDRSRVSIFGNNRNDTDETDDKKVEISIDPSTLRSIHHYRKSYRRYLRQTSHEEVRGFSPWAVTNQICDLILDDCLREIALEVNKIPSSFIMDLYNEEFAQTSFEQPTI